MHLTSSPADWYAARAAGIVAYILVSVVVSLGLTMSGRKTLRRWPRFALEDVHRFGGLLVGSFVILHVAAVAIDSYLPFSLAALAVPFVSVYKPIWVALGIVAAELLLALAVTNRYRTRLSHRFWRRAHYLNFLVWGTATLHGLGSGTDRSSAWLLALYGVAIATVVSLTVWRALRSRGLPAWLGKTAPAAAAAAMLVVVGALAHGPLGFHPREWNAVRFTDRLSGELLRRTGVTRGIVSMAGRGDGRQRVLVRADLLIAPNRLLSTAFQMEYLPSGLVCRGKVSHVQAYGFDATCRIPSGAQRFVHAQWQAGEGTSLSGGVITAHA